MQITEILLEIFGKKYKVIGYNIGFVQANNHDTGNVSGEPLAEDLTIEIVSDGENDFVEWMTDTTKTEDGELSFMAGTQLKKTIKFEEGYLVGLRQNFGVVNTGRGNTRVITEDLTISFKKMDFGDVQFERAKAA